MELFYTKASPYANCVRILCSELGKEKDFRWIQTHPFENNPEFIAASPLGKVPCLVVDGESIFDSEVICDYIDQRFADGQMHAEIKENWALGTSFSLIAGLMDIAVARRLEALRMEEGKGSTFWWERQTSALERGLLSLQDKLELFPLDFSQLHINLACMLGYLDFRHPQLDWRSDAPELSNYFDELQQRPSIKANPYIG